MSFIGIKTTNPHDFLSATICYGSNHKLTALIKCVILVFNSLKKFFLHILPNLDFLGNFQKAIHFMLDLFFYT